MGLKERVYSVLIVSASRTFNDALQPLLPESKYTPVKLVTSISLAKQVLTERSFDYVIVNSPLPDDAGIRFAIDTSRSREAVVLLLVRSELHEEVHDRVVEHGVFTLPKPTSKQLIAMVLGWMSSARERLREWRKRKENQWQVKNMRMEKYLLLRDEINADIDRLVDLKTEIMKVIDAVPDEDCRCVLEKHFLQGKSYTVIGQEMGYTGHYVSEKCRKALEKVHVPEKTS